MQQIISSAISSKETSNSLFWHIICGKRHRDYYETMYKHKFTHDRNSKI